MEQKTFIINSNNAGKRLDIFLLSVLDLTRSAIKKLIEEGNVAVGRAQIAAEAAQVGEGGTPALPEKNTPVKAGYALKEGEQVFVTLPTLKPTDILPQNIALDIVYEDDDLAVINKPQGMVVHPAGGSFSGTLVNALLYNIKNLSGINGEIRPGIVHRLDKDTSGLLVIAKNDKAHINLSKQIQNKTCKRIYRGIVVGNVAKDSGTVTTYLARGKHERKKIFVVNPGEGRLAITHYKVLQRFKGYTFMEFELETGRTHQIRVHMAHIGHALLGDPVYGSKENNDAFINKYFKGISGNQARKKTVLVRGENNEVIGEYSQKAESKTTNFELNGQMLHAYKLEFMHPTTKEPMSFAAPLPQYFESALKQLNLNV